MAEAEFAHRGESVADPTWPSEFLGRWRRSLRVLEVEPSTSGDPQGIQGGDPGRGLLGQEFPGRPAERKPLTLAS